MKLDNVPDNPLTLEAVQSMIDHIKNWMNDPNPVIPFNPRVYPYDVVLLAKELAERADEPLEYVLSMVDARQYIRVNGYFACSIPARRAFECEMERYI